MNHTKVAVIGSLNMDIVVETPRHPRVGETLLGDRVRFVPGGKGANQAVAAARLGAENAMIGAVGDDAFGLELLNALGRDGVDVTGVKRLSGTATGIASIYVGEGDNSIVVVPGANDRVGPEDIDRNEAKLKEADIVLLRLEIPVETALYAARKAKSLGKTVVLNPAPAQPLPEEPVSLRRLYDAEPDRAERLYRHCRRRNYAWCGHAALEEAGSRQRRYDAGGWRIGLFGRKRRGAFRYGPSGAGDRYDGGGRLL